MDAVPAPAAPTSAPESIKIIRSEISSLYNKLNKTPYAHEKFRLCTKERTRLLLQLNQLHLDSETDHSSEKYGNLVKQRDQLQLEHRIWDELITLHTYHESIDAGAASFVSLWLNSHLGWAHTDYPEKREKAQQQTLRRQLLQIPGSLDTLREDYAWCPILRQRIRLSSMHAAHIFPVNHGELHMRSIFGTRNELYDIRNALLMSEAAEVLFDRGYFAFVPSIKEDPDDVDIRHWQRGKRPFKIEIFEWEAKSMEEPLPDGSGFPPGTRWVDLDGQEVKFPNDSLHLRPRSRYLYFHYLFCLDRVLMQRSKNQRNVRLQREFGRKVWASTGQYIGTTYLRAFAATYGHDLKHLLCNSRGIDDGSEPLYALKEAFAAQLSAVTTERKEIECDVGSEDPGLSSEDTCNGDGCEI